MKLIRLTSMLVTLGMAALAVSVYATPRPLVVHVETVPLAWGECRLSQALMSELSHNSNLSPVTAELSPSESPPLPVNGFDPESWIDWGTEVGGRYLLVVTVEREELERRKTFSLPLIFQRWETIGVVSGELKLFDLQKRRLLVAEEFTEEMTGSRQFQGSTDKNRNDPSLHIPAPDKSRFFAELERKLAEKVAKRVKQFARGR